MPKIDDPVPKAIKPYLFHGVSVNWKHPSEGSTGLYAMGDCPFCGRENKFKVEVESGIYGCFKCEVQPGNISTFLKWLHEKSVERTTEYHKLSVDRGLINGVGLVQWGVCKSIMTGDWVIPAFNSQGTLNQLYKYVWVKSEKRMVTMPTPLGHHGVHGVNLYRPENMIVFVCEGWSDGVALYEMLLQMKQDEEGHFHLTGNPDKALINDANVIAVPTASSPSSESFVRYLPLFSGRVVNLMFDSDHPRINEKTGEQVDGAGIHHMRRVARLLHGAHSPPEAINFLNWGEFGCDKTRKSGWDVRDHINA
jgi:hypothetical protein